jgi:hypothetical protein
MSDSGESDRILTTLLTGTKGEGWRKGEGGSKEE